MRNILILVAGLLLGAIATAYFLGAPKGQALPGVPLKPPDATADTSGTVAVTVDEKFFNWLLGTIFKHLDQRNLKLWKNKARIPIRQPVFQVSPCSDVL